MRACDPPHRGVARQETRLGLWVQSWGRSEPRGPLTDGVSAFGAAPQAGFGRCRTDARGRASPHRREVTGRKAGDDHPVASRISLAATSKPSKTGRTTSRTIRSGRSRATNCNASPRPPLSARRGLCRAAERSPRRFPDASQALRLGSASGVPPNPPAGLQAVSTRSAWGLFHVPSPRRRSLTTGAEACLPGGIRRKGDDLSPTPSPDAPGYTLHSET